MEKINVDILVVGGGAAGCFAAIKAKENRVGNVLIVDKGYVGMSGCSKFAAGSFKCFIPDKDSYELWLNKAVEEGYFINDQRWTELHLQEVFKRARELDAWGVKFIKNDKGEFDRLEGQGSSDERPIKTIMFEGPQLMKALRKRVCQMKVDILDKTMITHLLHKKNEQNTISGALGFDIRTGELRVFTAKAVILCAGPQAYKSHYAYQKMATGDAHVMGLRAGAKLSNYEFCCHHLSCADFDTTGMNVLQGSGARFVNSRGETFMYRYDSEYGDHAAMNRLSAGMACEVLQGNGPIYFDFSGFDKNALSYFKKTLPIMYRAFERAGYIRDGKIKERVEWVSVNMGNVGYGGGIRINTRCETDLAGLYAAGDATCGPASGVEGFCAYAIPFAVTSGAISGKAASRYIDDVGDLIPDSNEIKLFSKEVEGPLKRTNGVEPDFVTAKVQETIFPMRIYIIRKKERLEKALEMISILRDEYIPLLKAYDPHYLRMAVEASNMVTCGELFLRAALARTESRGSHLREDYPEIDNVDWLKWIILKGRDKDISVSMEEIPIDTFPIKPERKRYTHPVAGLMRLSH